MAASTVAIDAPHDTAIKLQICEYADRGSVKTRVTSMKELDCCLQV
jgi:hypothetical protein